MKDGRPATSRAIPPMIIEALKMLVAQQRQAAAGANPGDPDDDGGGTCASGGRPQRALDGLGQLLGPLAADDQERSVGQLEPDAAVARAMRRARRRGRSGAPQKP